MKYIFTFALILLAFPSFASGQEFERKTLQNNNATEEVRRIEHQWFEAEMRQDRATLDRLVADDFMGVDAQGKTITKAQMMAGESPSSKQGLSASFDNVVRVYGEMAVAFTNVTMKGRSDSPNAGTQYRYLKVYVKRGGRWQIVAQQVTRLAKE